MYVSCMYPLRFRCIFRQCNYFFRYDDSLMWFPEYYWCNVSTANCKRKVNRLLVKDRHPWMLGGGTQDTTPCHGGASSTRGTGELGRKRRVVGSHGPHPLTLHLFLRERHIPMIL